MNILVTKNNVQIDTREIVHEGEYNVNTLFFTFTQDYDGLSKMAVFSNLTNSYELAITNNMCLIPAEIVADRGCFTLGVYAYTMVDDEIVKRYSPAPIELKIDDGSYVRALNPQGTEPTLFQTFAQQIEEQFDNVTDAIGDNTDEINDLKDRATALENGKQDKLTAGSHITINNNVISSDGEPNVITKIQKNGTDLPINNKTVNIPIPTKTSDITNDSGFITKEVNNLTNYLLKVNTGATLEATINNTTYVMTLKLKNSSGTALSTQTIDLPLETMVIDASYDSATKEIVLYLKNGNTVRFSVADLISGLQEEITPANKLSSDLVDDNGHTNKFVTQAEKTKLAGIEAGAEVNVIEEVKVNNEALPITNKSVNIDLTGIETDIETLQTENAELLDQIPTDAVTGKAIHIEDSSNLPFKEVELLGNASQDTSILYYKCVGTETGDYYFTYDNINYQFTMPTITANELLIFDTTTLKLYQGTTEITTTTASTGTLITLSATPSPDYEVPIKVVTGDNTIKVIGKNLYNLNATPDGKRYCSSSTSGQNITVTGTHQTTNGRVWWNIPVEVGKNYTISYSSLTESTESAVNKIQYGFSDTIINSSNYTQLPSNNIDKTLKSVTATATSKYLVVILRVANPNITITFSNIQVEQSQEATTYEPYTEQTQLISLGDIELARIGDYKDTIFKAEVGNEFYDNLSSEIKATLTLGKWYKYGAIHKAVYNGTEGFVVQNTYDDYILYRYNPATAYRKITGLYNIMCNRLQANGNTKNSILGQTSGYQIQVGLSKEFATDITTFNLWLSSNNLITYYVLGTPTITEITNETLVGQLENWLKMKTNRNITNIYTDTDNEQPTQKVEYRQDITTLIDDLREAIVAIGNT